MKRGTLAILIRRRSHQGHVSIMNVQLPAPKPIRHGVDRAEIDHIERTQGKHIRHAGIEDRLEPRRPARQNPANDHVRNLGRRDVENAPDQPGFNELLHGVSACPRGMENQAVEPLPFECFPHPGDTRCGYAEHRHPHGRFADGSRSGKAHHPRHGRCCVAQHLAAKRS